MNHNLSLQNTEQTNFPAKGLLEYAHFGYMWTTLNTKKIIASHTVYEMLEMEPFSEFLSVQTWRSYVHTKDLYKLVHAEEKLFTDKEPCSVEYRMITKKGKHIFVNHHMQLTINYEGEVKIISVLDDTTEQKHAEIILEIINECFFEVDRHYKFMRINAKTELFWNILRDDIIGESIWDVFPQAKDTEFCQLVTKAIHEKASILQQAFDPISCRWVHFSATPNNDGAIVIFYDIQHEKDAEQRARAAEALRESEERKSFLLKLSDAIRFHIDPVQIQAITAQLLGEHLNANLVHYAENEGDHVTIHETWSNGIPSITGSVQPEAFGKRLVAGLRAGKTQVCYDANTDTSISKAERTQLTTTKIIAYIAVPLIKKGAWVATLAVHTNSVRNWQKHEIDLVEEVVERIWAAVERAKGEEALQVSEQKFSVLSNTAPALIWFDDSAGNCVYVNDEYLQFSGKTTKEVEGQGWHLMLHEEDKENYISEFLECVRDRRLFHQMVRIRRHDGEWRWLESFAQPLNDTADRLLGYVGISLDITERRKTEALLRESEENYRSRLEQEVSTRTTELKESKDLLQSVFDSTVNIISVLQAVRNEKEELIDFRVLKINALALQFEDRDITGMLYSEVHPGVKQTEIFGRFKSVVETGITTEFEVHYNNENIPQGWYRIKAVKMGDGLVAAGENITERKKAELELQQQANFINTVAGATADILFVMNIDTKKILYASRKVAEDLGYEPGQIREMKEPYFDMMHPEDVPKMIEHLENMRNTKDGEVREIEYRLKHADGTYYSYCDRSTIFRRDEAGKVIEKLSIAQDITMRKKDEDEIKKQHKILSQSEDIAGIGSWEYDSETKDFEWSDGMYRLFFLEKGTPVKPSVYFDYVLEEDKPIAERLVNAIEKNFEAYEDTFRIKSGDNNIKTLSIKAGPLRNNSGQVEKMLGVDMDITSAKAAEAKIHALNKTLTEKNRELESINEEIRTLNSIAANDYRETLRHLYTNLEFIISNEARQLSDAGKANIRRAQAGIQKLKLLTDDIVSFSKLQSLDTSLIDVNLNETLKIVLQDMYEKIIGANAKIEETALPVINGYPLLLSLLFHHLIDNALKFRNNNEKVLIQINYQKVQKLQIDNAMPGIAYHQISIADNGIGFEQSEAEKIFTMFYRLHDKTKYRGSGVGLAICKKIMDIHNGFISAESSINNETRFDCFFPANA